MFFGSHLSVKDGYLNMAKLATKMGANTFQFFTRNPRGSKKKEINPTDVSNLRTYLKDNDFGRIVAHAPYTLNPCSDKKTVRDFGLEVIKDDLNILEMLPGNIYNFHPGSHIKQGVDVGIELTSELLNKVLTENISTTVAIETMAGKGTEIGSNFSEIKEIINRVDLNHKLGVVIDTCHIFESGMNIKDDFLRVMDEFDKILGFDRLVAIHLNDSKKFCGARKDRHELIGLGALGVETFREIVNFPEFKDLSMILETPTDEEGHKKEIELLKSLVK